MSPNPFMKILAMGPLRRAKSWPIYVVNGYKFHTSSWGEGRSTYNSGVCVSGTRQDGTISEYYGVLKEIIELEWPMTSCMNLQVIGIEDGHNLIEEEDKKISSQEEEGDDETTSEKEDEEEEATSEEEEFFDSDDSVGQEEDEDENEED
ncbi:hypothetical protein RDI58_007100 [Solanum bulbocastanum]|uniref:Uncharacterized protein n=1 Tax=Solanum bulbocastanum TaxID=147425 RepID=A0AAN8YIJ8_SOLBU